MEFSRRLRAPRVGRPRCEGDCSEEEVHQALPAVEPLLRTLKSAREEDCEFGQFRAWRTLVRRHVTSPVASHPIILISPVGSKSELIGARVGCLGLPGVVEAETNCVNFGILPHIPFLTHLKYLPRQVGHTPPCCGGGSLVTGGLVAINVITTDQHRGRDLSSPLPTAPPSSTSSAIARTISHHLMCVVVVMTIMVRG